jgi:uncharacterized protein YndB with AHSA1/START domain
MNTACLPPLRRGLLALPLAALALAALPARAGVEQAAGDGFLLTYSVPLSAPPAKAWSALAQVQHWWSDEHTWSGKAANLSLQATAGGCFCERWADGSAEHGRVVMALPERLLRLDTVLGPLQEYALKGVLNVWIRNADDGASALDVEYRVSGAAGAGLDQLAPQVDELLGAEIARLARYVDTGRPDAPAATPEQAAQAEAASAAASRAAILEQWKASVAAQAAAAKPAGKPAARTRKPADGR